QRQDVLSTEEFAQRSFDLLVEHWAAQHPRPTGMGSPRPEERGDALDHVWIEVQPQVVARREVRQPVVPDADPAPVHLIDDGVEHRVRRLETAEPVGGSEPLRQPAVRDRRRYGTAGARGIAHDPLLSSDGLAPDPLSPPCPRIVYGR